MQYSILASNAGKKAPSFDKYLSQAGLKDNTNEFLKNAGTRRRQFGIPDGTINKKGHLAAVPDEDDWGDMDARDMDEHLEAELNRSYRESDYPDEE